MGWGHPSPIEEDTHLHWWWCWCGWGRRRYSTHLQYIFWDSQICGWPQYGTLQAWINVGHVLLNSSHFLAFEWLSNFQAFADKFIDWDWAPIWWVNSLWAYPSLSNFGSHSAEFSFPGLWFVKQCSHNCRQNADPIELQVEGSTYSRHSPVWLTFAHTSLNFCHFMASD